MNDDYYVGLDLGSNSVGWAVTDEDYNLKRLKGKHAWGARIFSTDDENKTGSKLRRGYRSTRRRLQRRRYRIELLNDIFAEEINKVDNTFFLRMDNSTYLLEDKDNKIGTRNLIFKKRQDEIDFYKKYPTIWHLRLKLINNDKEALSDIRNVYLAMHHIYKYRGNFLVEGTYDSKELDKNILNDINQYFKNKLEAEEIDFEGDIISSSKSDELIRILLSDDTKTSKKGKIKALFNDVVVKEKDFSLKDYIEMFYTLVAGSKYALKKIVPESELEIDFNKADFDDHIGEYENELGNDFFLVKKAKEIYDFCCVKKLLGDNSSLSEAMVNIYEKHKVDLEKLKKVIKDIDSNEALEGKESLYFKIFNDENNMLGYEALVRGVNSKRCSLTDFDKEISKILEEHKEYISEEDKEEVENIKESCKNQEYLRIIAHASDSKIPHQLHWMELEKIIDNCKELYPFLDKGKMKKLFEFRVPYYCGPLANNLKGEEKGTNIYSNVERYSNVPVTPWNFDEIIDKNESRKNFMNKLVGRCSYLTSEKVLPKTSLIYEEYMVRNVVNKMLVNGVCLEGEEKEEVVEFILSKSKTTLKQVKTHLSSMGKGDVKDILISNIDEGIVFQAPAYSYIKKTNIFDLKNKDTFDMVEEMIFLATVYADDKKSLKETLVDSNNFTEGQIKCILNIPTNKWARLSKELLVGIHYEDDKGITHSIMDVLRETNKNFMEIINDKEYGFNDFINEYNEEKFGKMTESERIEEILDGTPANAKRTINQTLLVLDDIVKITKHTPKKLFIEVTREDDEKKKGKKSTPRKKELDDFIKALKKDKKYLSDVNEIEKELNEIDLDKINSRHVYLYFKQMGYDMYTGKKIDLNDVINHSQNYDLDHIIPQSLIKDDSLDNLVLVDRNMNQKVKKDFYPIPSVIRNDKKVTDIWNYLRKMNMISEKKYVNLMRSSEISEDEINNFVNSQINIVNSSNIAIKKILEVKYPEVKVVFSKAQYPSYLRKELRVFKNRDLNDTHHAVDAYLNIVSGNVLSTKFSDVRRIYAEKMSHIKNKTFNMENTLENFLKESDEKGELYSNKIRKNCLRRDILVTFKLEYDSGAFYKATINKKSDSSALYGVHTKGPMKDTSKYGGYTSLSQAYLMAVSYEIKGKKVKKLLRVPVLLDRVYSNDSETLLTKVVDEEKATNIKLIKKINLNQKIKYHRCEYLLYTCNASCNKFKMARQNYIDNDHIEYINQCNKYIEKIDDNKDIQNIPVNRKGETFEISKEKNKALFDELLETIKLKVYDSCTYLVKCRNIKESEFDLLTLKEQIDTINSLIKVLTRNCETVVFNGRFEEAPKTILLRPSMDITKEEISLIYDSPTGLIKVEEQI